MKLIIKRVLLGMCLAACLFSLSACGRAKEALPQVDMETQLRLKQDAVSYLAAYLKVRDEQIDDMRSKFAKKDEALADGLDTWENVKHDLGGFVGIFENSEVTELKHGYSIVLHTQFEKREMDFTVTSDEAYAVTSIAFAPRYSIAENMEKAFFNMILGMGTVFIVLIFISFLISRFKYIGRFEEAMKNRKKNEGEAARSGNGQAGDIHSGAKGPATEGLSVNMADALNGGESGINGGEGALAGGQAVDAQLVAVITAAIAAARGTNPSGLVVRSIRRSSAGKWKKA